MRVFATACDDYYADEALNLVSSVLVNANEFDAIYVYDLGISRSKLRRFQNIPKVAVRKVPAFTEHWRQHWSWKSWVWIDALKQADSLIYLDAGVEVLKSLKPVIELVDTEGYFVVSQVSTFNGDHRLKEIIPSDYYQKFNLPQQIKSKEVVAGGLVGIKKDSKFYREVVKSCFELVLQGYNLGWSQIELFRNKDINYLENSPIRDCELFRHDQTLLNMLFYTKITKPRVQPMKKYGATTLDSTNEQVFWSSRKLGNMHYVYKVPYKHLSSVKNLRNFLLIYIKHRILKLTPYYERVVRKIKWILKDKRHAKKS